MKTLEEYIKENRLKNNNPDKELGFLDYYFKLLNKKGLKDSDVYNNVYMSRQTYSKIISNKMIPSLNNAVRLAIGLKTTNNECKLLLKKLGYTLASSSLFSLVIRYSFDNEIYNIDEINRLLDSVGLETL